MSFLSSNQSYTLTSTVTCNLMDHSKCKKKTVIILTSQTFTVIQSPSGTSGSNVMVHIKVIFSYVSCIEFPKKISF